MDVLRAVAASQIVAVIRAPRVVDPRGLIEALGGAGIRCVEFTFTIPDALHVIGAASADPRTVVGAGTVLHADQARRAIDAGAAFVVCPILEPEVASACGEGGVPCFLGGLTPTEIVTARNLGASAVKLFPASAVGPGYVKELRGPLPEIPLIPSGGIDGSNARAFLRAGALGVFAGSAVAPAQLVAAGEHEEISRTARAFVEAINATSEQG
jgi:2-dehydro-3-deoxyphosphogluconate aldolase/(4S)-4-hydroxy-2-oxoglutarate aldolase